MTRELFALLTRIRLPGSRTDLAAAARIQHLFSLVGFAVGLVLALVAVVFSTLLGERAALVSGAGLMVVLYSITGIMHLEGLADLADGMMAKGPPERKREVVKDPHSGVGGVFAVVMYLIVLFAVTAYLFSFGDRATEPFPFPWELSVMVGFVMAEMAGKLAMNTAMYLGPSAHAGMGSLFVQEARPGRLAIATLLAGALAFVVAGYLFFLVFIGFAAGGAMAVVCRRHFGGVSGDAFGAANEIGRLVTLMAWVLVI